MISIPLYLSVENDCEYLSGNKSRIVFVAQDFPMTSDVYSQLAGKGLRRSGEMVYGPVIIQTPTPKLDKPSVL